MAALRAKIDSDQIQALELRVFPDHIVLQAQDPKRPTNVDQYLYRAGKVTGPVPVKLKGKGALADNLFPLDEIQLHFIPPVAGKALEQLRLENGVVKYVSVMRNLPTEMDVRLRVYVTSPRKDGSLMADVTGNLLPQNPANPKKPKRP